jgi:ParB family chromosome partitioning protein
MSKADQLGAGRFGGAARPVSARRAAIGAATGVPTEGVAPPSRLPVGRISANPENPRTTLGDLTELAASLKEHGQKQAVTVMNRDAYVKANPDREKDLHPDATHVVVDGSSRLEAAREAGLTHLNVMVDDDQGSDGDAILESALVANIHRNDLDPLDEARALQRLLAIHGSQVKLARRLRKSQGWVSQRLALLNLSPELQAVIGEERVELLRTVAKEPQDRQEAALEELKAERARREAERKAASVPVPPAPPQVAPAEVAPAPVDPAPVEPSSTPTPPSPASVEQWNVPADPSPEAPAVSDQQIKDAQAHRGPAGESIAERADTVPEPRSDNAHSIPATDQELSDNGASATRRLPYDNGAFLAMHLIRKMSDTEFDRMLDILNKHQRERLDSQTAVH